MDRSIREIVRWRSAVSVPKTRRIAITQMASLATLLLAGVNVLAAEPVKSPSMKAGPPVLPEDLAFLRKDPLRKQKQMVDPTGIDSAAEAAVLARAIEGVIMFCISLPYGKPTESAGRGLRHITARGLELVQLPPPLPHDATRGHNPQRYSNWDIRNDHELVVTVDYGAMENGRMKWPPMASWRMIFIEVDGVWKFDHYDQ